jgi:hypothetical protein
MSCFSGMELLLNLAWILLALPSYWLWRRGESARAAGRVSGLQFLLALGCGIVLLFPVISATDDLHAMRAEMEESSTSKRAVRLASGEKSSGFVNRLQGAPALLASVLGLAAPRVGRWEILVPHFAALARSYAWHVGRAPPPSFRR